MTIEARKDSGGFGAILDFGFHQFITLSIIKILYMLGLGVIALVVLLAVIGGFTRGFGPGIGMLILAPLLGALYLIMLRIWLELIVVVFRIAENTGKLVELRGGKSAETLASAPPPSPV